MRTEIIYWIILLSTYCKAQELVNIGILNSLKLTSIKIFSQNDYSLQYESNDELLKLSKNNFYRIEVINDSMLLLDNISGKKIIAKSLRFYSPDVHSTQFSIISENIRKDRLYKGNLKVWVQEGYLKMVNTLELDDYVCGVIDAEVGKGRHPEFYKAQALLVRTYALSHLYKHLNEGFNLCDNVHCQVYHGVCTASNILKAVEETHNQVITDKDLNLIVAAFHSNSGGETVNSEDIWGAKKEYLRSVKDSFSIGMPGYYWQKKMPLVEWIKYLNKYRYPIHDSNALRTALNFQQHSRKVYLQYENVKIPLKNIRDDLKLMSTFFSISLNSSKDTVVFKGRGFGHGVGLSQEGAMKMAAMGWNYQQIINFYFKNILIIDLKKLNFFREE